MSAKKTSIKEAVEKIRKLLFDADPAGGGDPAASKDYTLEDGTNIKVLGELVQGTEVKVVTDQGESPIPDGQYTLNDGSSITCVGGAISEVAAKEPDADDAGMEMKAKMEAQEKQITTLVEGLKTVTEALNKLQAGFNKQAEASKALLDVVSKISEGSAADPVTIPAAFQKKVDRAEKMAELTSALKKLKENKE